MTRLLLSLFFGVGLLGSIPSARAFTLYGEIPTWFTDQTGLIPNGDVYGPMNLGEEYRWPVPQIIYAFDESFLNYFGQRGVDEVEKAIQIINDLPAMSDLNIDDYPNFSMRVNYRARDLSLIDLKSEALKLVVEELGLGTPGRFVFTSHYRDTPANATNYLVVMRNFDPQTWEPTPYINGQLWTYLSIFDNQDSPTIKSSTIPEPVDPLLLAEPVASASPAFAPSVYGFGSFFTGLTRDDVGGLRYIYRPDNQNVETLPADATGAAGSFTGGGGGGTGAWTPIPAPSTNNTGTGTGGQTGGTGGITPTAAFFAQGLRGGINLIRFVRSGTGAIFDPAGYAVTNRFTEEVRVVVTNGVERTVSQRVIRALAAPDILFGAQDGAQPNTAVTYAFRSDNATSNDTINGNRTLDGPGQFAGPGFISFNKTGPAFQNFQPAFLSQPSQIPDFVWGSFDGSTNDPIVYPSGTSIRELEQRIFGGR